MNEAIRMQLSAFVDGELPENEKELLLCRLGQDPALRDELAKYVAIGRAMRGELQPAGLERLRERVAQAVDGDQAAEQRVPASDTSGRRLRLFGGIAMAASVALVALVGLQQFAADDAPVGAVDADAVAGSSYTEPNPDELLRQLMLHHEQSASENSIRARLTSIELSRDVVADEDDEAEDAVAPTADDDAQ